MIRACALEDERIDRAASMYSGVCKWAREAGAGEVMFGTVTDTQITADSYLVEGSVYRSLSDPAAKPDIYHWICTRDGNVVQAFGQSEWGGAKPLARGQATDPGR